jgi:hypothetical protein
VIADPGATTPRFGYVRFYQNANASTGLRLQYESGRSEIYIQTFPAPQNGGSKTPISRDGGSQPRWRRDGKELFYVSSDGIRTEMAGGLEQAGRRRAGGKVVGHGIGRYDKSARLGRGYRPCRSLRLLGPISGSPVGTGVERGEFA